MEDNEIYQIAGSKKNLLQELLVFLRSNYSPLEKPTFSKKSGWTIFFRKAGKPLCYINLFDGGFRVIVVIGITLADKVDQADLSPKAKAMFKEAHQFHDGKWLTFQVTTPSDLEDIKTLIQIKRLIMVKSPNNDIFPKAKKV